MNSFLKALIVIIAVILLALAFAVVKFIPMSKYENDISNANTTNNELENNQTSIVVLNENEKKEKEITDWRLVLVNYENQIPADFEIDLANIDNTRKFDSRAIEFLNQMMKKMKQDGIRGVWVQSAYRSVEYQQQLYNEKVQEFVNLGLSLEEAEKRTLLLINKPETSEHNLGLAIDFNYVDIDFDKTKGYKWLTEHAHEFGFILRYQKEKEDITKVSYEPWHWRFVGIEHAIEINKLNMCLEEYIEHLKNL